MHKYFARRPHNVFKYLIESYTSPNDIILDPFLGGGVTLFEGLALERRVVGVDINPIATFVSESQTTKVAISEYKKIIDEIRREYLPFTEKYFTTINPKTLSHANVRWYELAYKVKCHNCQTPFLLSDNNKEINKGHQVNGRYTCPSCKISIAAVGADRIGYELISTTYLVDSKSMKRDTKKANEFDINLMKDIEQDFEKLITEHGLWYPTDVIPETWDRQQEDCLQRKSITKFSDFYTKRSLFLNALLFKLFMNYKGKVTPELFKLLLFTFSAILRFTNNMTISTGNWMDGRPVAWAKHAYWIPNQFVEVNPIEYFDKRTDAIIAGLKYQNQVLHKSLQVETFEELSTKQGTHIIWTQSSKHLNLPDGCVDAIITDPPYGSNVQYGELTHYWQVWLRDEIKLGEGLFNLGNEVLVTRKSSKKSYQDYYQGLHDVFIEGFRVLKLGGIMVFTFNNKDIRAWYAVIRAAINAGFTLEPEGIIYQEPIENYKNTAHTRFAGSMHGDFIYTFRKINRKKIMKQSESLEISNVTKSAEDVIKAYTQKNVMATTSELYIAVFQNLIPVLAQIVSINGNIEAINSFFESNNLDVLIKKHLVYDSKSGYWKKT